MLYRLFSLKKQNLESILIEFNIPGPWDPTVLPHGQQQRHQISHNGLCKGQLDILKVFLTKGNLIENSMQSNLLFLAGTNLND